MTDKENIRAYIEKLHKEHRGSEGDSIFRQALRTVLFYIDSLQEEPKKCMYSKDDYTDEDRKVLCDGCKEECKYNKSDDFTKALAECIHQAQGNVIDPMVLAETWKDELIKLAKSEEPVSEELEDAADTESKKWGSDIFPFPYRSWLRQCFIKGANWQKEQMMAKAIDGIARPYDNEIWCILDSFNLEDGDKVKVIVIKED